MSFIEETKAAEEETVYKYDWCLALLATQLGHFSSWSIENKHQFDEIMVACGQLEECFNQLPSNDSIDQISALALLQTEIMGKYSLSTEYYLSLDMEMSYVSSQTYPPAVWRFALLSQDRANGLEAVMSSQGEIVSVEVLSGKALEETADMFYQRLTEEKGVFCKWSLEDKAWLSERLSRLIAADERNDIEVLQEIRVIADHCFCMPPEGEVISQTEATQIAISFVREAYDLPENWETNFEVYYSFFPTEKQEGWIWRITFWKNSIQDYHGGLVEINAVDGSIYNSRANGTSFDTSIPYLDRL